MTESPIDPAAAPVAALIQTYQEQVRPKIVEAARTGFIAMVEAAMPPGMVDHPGLAMARDFEAFLKSDVGTEASDQIDAAVRTGAIIVYLEIEHARRTTWEKEVERRLGASAFVPE